MTAFSRRLIPTLIGALSLAVPLFAQPLLSEPRGSRADGQCPGGQGIAAESGLQLMEKDPLSPEDTAGRRPKMRQIGRAIVN
ncbi:MAG: hypothetical protein JWO56_3594 [Acidobacteria bacterium]|nr:hypothetical protein [Acidobacteriota bacterium]